MAKRQIPVEAQRQQKVGHNRQQILHTTINTPSNVLLLCVISKATHRGGCVQTGRGNRCRRPNRKAKSVNIYPQGLVETAEELPEWHVAYIFDR